MIALFAHRKYSAWEVVASLKYY